MIDDTTTRVQIGSFHEHKPPQYLVKESTPAAFFADDIYHEADTPEEALEKAREIAARTPDGMVDVYHHAVTVRLRPDPPETL